MGSGHRSDGRVGPPSAGGSTRAHKGEKPTPRFRGSSLARREGGATSLKTQPSRGPGPRAGGKGAQGPPCSIARARGPASCRQQVNRVGRGQAESASALTACESLLGGSSFIEGGPGYTRDPRNGIGHTSAENMCPLLDVSSILLSPLLSLWRF